jgi:hypothetical protein
VHEIRFPIPSLLARMSSPADDVGFFGDGHKKEKSIKPRVSWVPQPSPTPRGLILYCFAWG